MVGHLDFSGIATVNIITIVGVSVMNLTQRLNLIFLDGAIGLKSHMVMTLFYS
jgi:hypothetical protein